MKLRDIVLLILFAAYVVGCTLSADDWYARNTGEFEKYAGGYYYRLSLTETDFEIMVYENDTGILKWGYRGDLVNQVSWIDNSRDPSGFYQFDVTNYERYIEASGSWISGDDLKVLVNGAGSEVIATADVVTLTLDFDRNGSFDDPDDWGAGGYRI